MSLADYCLSLHLIYFTFHKEHNTTLYSKARKIPKNTQDKFDMTNQKYEMPYFGVSKNQTGVLFFSGGWGLSVDDSIQSIAHCQIINI